MRAKRTLQLVYLVQYDYKVQRKMARHWIVPLQCSSSKPRDPGLLLVLLVLLVLTVFHELEPVLEKSIKMCWVKISMNGFILCKFMNYY